MVRYVSKKMNVYIYIEPFHSIEVHFSNKACPENPWRQLRRDLSGHYMESGSFRWGKTDLYDKYSSTTDVLRWSGPGSGKHQSSIPGELRGLQPWWHLRGSLRLRSGGVQSDRRAGVMYCRSDEEKKRNGLEM